jgi:hypothetical protein
MPGNPLEIQESLKVKRVDPAHPCISAAMGIGDADQPLGHGVGIGDEVRPRA